MLTAQKAGEQYCLDKPYLPQRFCDRKNRALVVGRRCSELREKDDHVTFTLKIEAGEITVEVMVEKSLYSRLGLNGSELLAVLGRFSTYYRKLRMYRPLIQVRAERIEPFSEEFQLSEQLKRGFYPNRVYIEGVVAENPVKYMTGEGEISFNLSVLSDGVVIPCTVSGEAMERIGLDTIMEAERYRLWGIFKIRQYQKRLGRGMILQNETMNEVLIDRLDSVGAAHTGDIAGAVPGQEGEP